MPRKAELLNSLTRGKVRTSWNKYNLFNLYKKQRAFFKGKSSFQQKWVAKAETRAYHGDHITEKRWGATFDKNLHGVAQLDASLKGENLKPTPMSLQTYAVLEKRLDFAIFRSMFASSVRQARQFILHSEVQVNGIRIRSPGYQLKPGDVFSVAPEKVLEALGRIKPSLQQSLRTDSSQIASYNKYIKEAMANPRGVWEKRQRSQELLPYNKVDPEKNQRKIQKHNDSMLKEMLQKQKKHTKEIILKNVIKASVAAGGEPTEKSFSSYGPLSSKCLQMFQHLKQNELMTPVENVEEAEKIYYSRAKAYLSGKKENLSDEENTQLKKVKQLINEIHPNHLNQIREKYQKLMVDGASGKIPFDPNWAKKLKFVPPLNKEEILEDESKAVVKLPWQRHLFGREESEKRYFTPWTPRPFIGAFAILPHHIEVSFATCHAVYLRDPVARPGLSEVITPFSTDVQERAFMWYIRGGR